MKKLRTPKELDVLRSSLLKQRDPNKLSVIICLGTGCRARGSLDVSKAFTDEIIKHNLDIQIECKQTGCHGFCERGPVVVIGPKKIFYQKVRSHDVNEIVSKTLLNGEVVSRLLYIDPVTGQRATYEH